MRRIGPYLLVAAIAAYFAACDGAPLGTTGGERGDESTPRFDVSGTFPDVEDTYLALNRKNTNYGGESFLQVKKLEQDVAMVRFSDALIGDLAAGVDAGGRVFLDIEIDGTFANFGSGLSVGLYRVDGSPDWTETGATWNCGEDANTGNNQPDCPGGGWTWNPAGSRPVNSTATDVVTITSGQTGVVTFEVTDDIAAFGSGMPNNGWALGRETDDKSGYVRFMSSESGTPPLLRFDPCSEAEVAEAGCVFQVVEEEEPFVIPADGGTGSTIAAFGSFAGLEFGGTEETEVVFKVDVIGLGPCEDIPNAADVGVCTEITAFTTTGEPIPNITLTEDAQVAFCINYPGSGIEPLPDGTPVDPENAVDPLTRLADALLILQNDDGDRKLLPPSLVPGAAEAALECTDFEAIPPFASEGSPLMRLARRAFEPILGRLAPKSLYATASVAHTKAKGSFIDGLSRFHWTSALVLYSSDGWTVDLGEGTDEAMLPAGAPGSGCPLYSNAGQLNYVWPVGSEAEPSFLDLERGIAVQQAGDHVDASGKDLYLLVSVGIDNDIAVWANGDQITDYISDRGYHPTANSGSGHYTAGFDVGDVTFLTHEGCAFRDLDPNDHITGDITFAVPYDWVVYGGESILEVDSDEIFLEILGRDRGGSSFLDVQVSLMELDEVVGPD